jgi:hypothetical protein
MRRFRRRLGLWIMGVRPGVGTSVEYVGGEPKTLVLPARFELARGLKDRRS